MPVDLGCSMMAQALVELALMPGWSLEKKELRVAMALEQFMKEAAGPGADNREGGRFAASRQLSAAP